MIHLRRALVLAILFVLSTGCATITRGRSEAVDGEDATDRCRVTLSNGMTCRTPCALTIRRKYPFSVDVCKAGYKRVVTQVVSSIHGAGGVGLAGNVLLGGAIGAGVDVGTGAARDLEPNPLEITLEAEQPGCQTPTAPPIPEGGADPAEKKPREVTLSREARAARGTVRAAHAAGYCDRVRFSTDARVGAGAGGRRRDAC